MTGPAAATARREALAALLRAGGGSSQSELVERLAGQGFAATQATVSRDLQALGAIRLSRGGQRLYQLGSRDSPSGLDAILADWAIAAEAAGPLVVIRTRPGSAHIVAAAIDADAPDWAAGTIAGDDTLFVAVRDGFDARREAAGLLG